MSVVVTMQHPDTGDRIPLSDWLDLWLPLLGCQCCDADNQERGAEFRRQLGEAICRSICSDTTHDPLCAAFTKEGA